MPDELDRLLDGVPAAREAQAAPDDPSWQSFAPETGTLGIPRASMPQIKSEHRGAMVQFLKGRGITHTQEMVAPDSLKPSQAEYSPEKVDKARGFDGPPRSVLISSDDHVLDGHHQWLAALDDAPSTPIPAIRLHAPALPLLMEAARFPSSGVDESSKDDKSTPKPATEPDDLDKLLAEVPDAPKSSRAVVPSSVHSSPVSDDYRARSSFAEGHNFTVTSTTDGGHNTGSAHYAGRAVDVRTKDKTPEEVEDFMEKARAAGYIVRDERVRPAGQARWSAPHIHLEKGAPDELDALLDDVPAAPSASAAPAEHSGDELDQVLASLPPLDENGDEVEQVNSAHAAPIPATHSRAFDPYDPAQRAQRDAAAAAEAQGARSVVTVPLPSGRRDWLDVPSDELMRDAYTQGARRRGVPDSFITQWLSSHPDALKLVDFTKETPEEKTPADLIGDKTDAYNSDARTMTVALDRLPELERDYQAWRSPAAHAVDFLTDDRTTAARRLRT
jgi:hypothetical protein